MILRNRNVLRGVFEFGCVIIIMSFIFQLGMTRMTAVADALPRPTPQGSPMPTATPKPTPPRALSMTHPTQPMWIVQGEVVGNEREYFCRVTCAEQWKNRTLEILQVTRGGEAWIALGGYTTVCTTSADDAGTWHLAAGRWTTPADSPEQSLCFLVLSEIRQ